MDYRSLNSDTLDNLIEGFQLIGYDWRYIYVNKAVIEQSKFTHKEELLGRTMMESYPGIDETELFGVLKRCMRKRNSELMSNQFNFPDGSIGWFELRIHPVPEGLFILSMDITERIKAEQERKKYTKALEELIYMASQKVRQPVTNILSLATLLDESLITFEELKDICLHMKTSAALLDTFTSELTYFIKDLKR